MRSIYLTLYLIMQIHGTTLFSQNSAGGLINQVRVLDTRNISSTLNYADVAGSPYYTSDFVKGTVYLETGNYASFPFRYDIFRDEIEFLKEGKVFWLIKKDVKSVLYGSEKLIVAHAISDTSRIGYFFLKDTGRYNLLVKKSISYYPLVPPKGYSETVPACFQSEADEYYLQQGKMPAQQIKNMKDLSIIFNGNQSVLNFIKREKIKIGKFEDLRKLVYFLNNEK